MWHLVHSQFADFDDSHFCGVTWGIIRMESNTFEAFFRAMRFYVGFQMGNCKFAELLGANAWIWWDGLNQSSSIYARYDQNHDFGRVDRGLWFRHWEVSGESPFTFLII
jgi:hypothetical protein